MSTQLRDLPSGADAACGPRAQFLLVLSTSQGEAWGTLLFSAFEALTIANALSPQAAKLASFEEAGTGRRVTRDELCEIAQQILAERPDSRESGQLIDLSGMPWCH